MPIWVAGHLPMRKPGAWVLFNGTPSHAAGGTHCSPLLPRGQDHTAQLRRQRVEETDCLGPTASPFPGAHSHHPPSEAREGGGRQRELCPDTQEHQRQSHNVGLETTFIFIILFQSSQGMYYYPHFIDEKTTARRCNICSRSHRLKGHIQDTCPSRK